MSSKMRNYPPFAGKKMHFFTSRAKKADTRGVTPS